MKSHCGQFLVTLLLLYFGVAVLEAQMNPDFTAINYPVPRNSLMVMALSDYQSARSTNDFFTGMMMVEYGLTQRWTAGFMVEGEKIYGMPTTYGGMRINSYYRLLPHDHLLNFTLYGEYEGLNGAALYKMEVSGFGGEDLSGPLTLARNTNARTFEQRAILYHDWGRTNLTFNFINETGLDTRKQLRLCLGSLSATRLYRNGKGQKHGRDGYGDGDNESASGILVTTPWIWH